MPILGCPEHQSWISICEGHPPQSALLVTMSEREIVTHKAFRVSEHLKLRLLFLLISKE